jgi:hypothetical protein
LLLPSGLVSLRAMETSFIEPLKQGHVFFYDLELDEVVHFRKEIYDAALEDNEGMDIDLTKEEEADAEDAWEIIEDENGRYEAMPRVPVEMVTAWESEFAAAGSKDWETFLATKMNEFVLNWLSEFEEDGADEVEASELPN